MPWVEPEHAPEPEPEAAAEPEEPHAFEPPAAPAPAETGGEAWDSFEPHLVPLGDFTGAGAGTAPAASPQDAALAASLAGVADRLEAAARALRERPAAFLAGGGDDPLELLLAGFALGYLQGNREGNG